MTVKLNYYSTIPWSDRLRQLLEILRKPSPLSPTRWGQNRPSSKDFPPGAVSELEEVWNRNGHLLFYSDSPDHWLQLTRRVWFPKNKKPNWLNVGIEDAIFSLVSTSGHILEFAKELFLWSSAVYGYISHETDYFRQNQFSTPTMVNGKLLSYLGTDIRQGLPGVYWANFFGSTYVKWFGIDKFRSIPCYEIEELPDGSKLVLTAPSPLAFRRGQEFEAKIKNYLGRDAFFDIDDPEKPLRSPFQDGTIVIE